VIEVVGTSPDTVDVAIRTGLESASQTIRNLDWIEVKSVRGDLTAGAIAYYRHPESRFLAGRFLS
jgi:flavin-binding protein dodecin